MTDQALGVALSEAERLEKAARAHWQTAATIAERDAALWTVRLVTPVIRALKDWIAMRAQALAET